MVQLIEIEAQNSENVHPTRTQEQRVGCKTLLAFVLGVACVSMVLVWPVATTPLAAAARRAGKSLRSKQDSTMAFLPMHPMRSSQPRSRSPVAPNLVNLATIQWSKKRQKEKGSDTKVDPLIWPFVGQRLQPEILTHEVAAVNLQFWRIMLAGDSEASSEFWQEMQHSGMLFAAAFKSEAKEVDFLNLAPRKLLAGDSEASTRFWRFMMEVPADFKDGGNSRSATEAFAAGPAATHGPAFEHTQLDTPSQAIKSVRRAQAELGKAMAEYTWNRKNALVDFEKSKKSVYIAETNLEAAVYVQFAGAKRAVESVQIAEIELSKAKAKHRWNKKNALADPNVGLVRLAETKVSEAVKQAKMELTFANVLLSGQTPKPIKQPVKDQGTRDFGNPIAVKQTLANLNLKFWQNALSGDTELDGSAQFWSRLLSAGPLFAQAFKNEAKEIAASKSTFTSMPDFAKPTLLGGSTQASHRFWRDLLDYERPGSATSRTDVDHDDVAKTYLVEALTAVTHLRQLRYEVSHVRAACADARKHELATQQAAATEKMLNVAEAKMTAALSEAQVKLVKANAYIFDNGKSSGTL